MSQSPETVVAYWNEHRQQLRQSETQRSILTNYLLAITAGLSGFVVQQRFAVHTMAIAALIVLIGTYGALSSAKYHERAVYHLTQARALTNVLKDIGALSAEGALLDTSRNDHYQAFPFLHRVRLHWLWTGMHLAIAAYGGVLALFIGLLTLAD